MQAKTYPITDRPRCWVRDPEAGDRWYRGHVHSWHHTPTGWVAICTWHIGVGLQKYLDVPEERLRAGDEADPNGAEGVPSRA